MQTRKVYCLTGATGEREDTVTWIVRCSTNKESIESQRDSLLSWVRKSGLYRGQSLYLESFPKSCPLDSSFQCDKCGVTYYVDEILVEID